MGCRDFESGSTNGILSATTGWASLGTAHTHAILCTVESLSGVSYLACGVGDGTAISALLALDSAASYSLAYTVGTNASAPGASMIPATGVPLLLAASKAAGTVAPTFFMHNYATCTTTVNAAGGTVANRTPGAVSLLIGNLLDTYLWDGQIGAVGQWNRALSEGELRSLTQGRSAWRALFGRGVVSNAAEAFIDLTQPGTIRDQLNPSIAFTGGTQPAFGPDTIRFPGW